MSAAHAYLATVFLLPVGVTAVFVLGMRKGTAFRFTAVELATIALLVCMLYVAVIPWSISLSRVPALDALIFSIPYTAVFVIGLQLVPKPGAATFLVLGQGLLGQLLGRGLNPLWWPYYAWCALAVELFLCVAGRNMRVLATAVGVAALRGVVSYIYTYLVLMPFLWHQFYAWWYVIMKLSLGTVGCMVGAYIAWRLAPRIEASARHAL
jgi:hypothetical protein